DPSSDSSSAPIWDTAKPSLEPTRREFVQVRMPRAYQREIQRVGYVRAELADVAWPGDVHNVGAKRANRFCHPPPMTPQQQVVAKIVFQREGNGPAHELELRTRTVLDPTGDRPCVNTEHRNSPSRGGGHQGPAGARDAVGLMKTVGEERYAKVGDHYPDMCKRASDRLTSTHARL